MVDCSCKPGCGLSRSCDKVVHFMYILIIFIQNFCYVGVISIGKIEIIKINVHCDVMLLKKIEFIKIAVLCDVMLRSLVDWY